jgi:hypothetical protein
VDFFVGFSGIQDGFSGFWISFWFSRILDRAYKFWILLVDQDWIGSLSLLIQR